VDSSINATVKSNTAIKSTRQVKSRRLLKSDGTALQVSSGVKVSSGGPLGSGRPRSIASDKVEQIRYQKAYMQVLNSGAAQCADVRKLLGEYVGKELPGTLQKTLDAHLAECSKCRSFKASYVSVIRTARHLPDPMLPDDARSRLHSALNKRLGLNLQPKK
jgi:Putative zinc-finger